MHLPTDSGGTEEHLNNGTIFAQCQSSVPCTIFLMQPKSVLAKVDLDVCVFAYVCLCENNLSYVAKPACDS